MKKVWIVWSKDCEGTFIVAIYDHKVRAEEDIRSCREQGSGTLFYIQERVITK